MPKFIPTKKCLLLSASLLSLCVIFFGLLGILVIDYTLDCMQDDPSDTSDTPDPWDTMTISSFDGITLRIYGQWRMDDHDVLLLTIANYSDTPFDTTAFRFDSQPLPDLPTYDLSPGLDMPPLPATVPTSDIVTGFLYLPHPDNMSGPWPPLVHPRGPFVIPLPLSMTK